MIVNATNTPPYTFYLKIGPCFLINEKIWENRAQKATYIWQSSPVPPICDFDLPELFRSAAATAKLSAQFYWVCPPQHTFFLLLVFAFRSGLLARLCTDQSYSHYLSIWVAGESPAVANSTLFASRYYSRNCNPWMAYFWTHHIWHRNLIRRPSTLILESANSSCISKEYKNWQSSFQLH